MTPSFDLSIIIVNYNAATFLRDCLASVRQQQGLRIQTIVVDNHSTDNSVQLVKTEFPEVELVCRDTSLGFSAGNNAGLKLATADHILFLNPDTKFTRRNTLKKCLHKYRTTSNIGMLTCRIDLVLTGDIDQTCHRGFPTPWVAFTHFTGLSRLAPRSRLLGQYYMAYADYNTEHDIDAAGGMFMLMSRRIGQQVGWWDEDYPLYGEDIDLCFRVKQAGYRIVYWPAETVLHYKGVTTGMNKKTRAITTASKSTIRQVKLWSIESMELFYNKHYRPRYPQLMTWMVLSGIRLLKFKRIHLS